MPKILLNFVKAILACYLFVCGFIWFFSPWIISQYLSPLLVDNNLALAEKTTIRYNPFITKLSISELELAQFDDATHTPLLSIDSAEIELSLWQLLSKTVHVSQFDIDGLKLKIDKLDEQINIGGWPIPTNSSTPPPNEPVAENTQGDYNLNIPDINVVNSLIKLNWLDHKHSIALTKVNLKQLHLSPHQQLGNISLAIALNNSPIQLDAEFGLNNLSGEIEYKLAVNELDLANFNHFVFPEDPIQRNQIYNNALLSGLLSLNYQQKIELDKKTIKAKFSDIDLSLSNLITRTQGAKVSIAQQQFMSNALQLDIKNWSIESPEIDLNGQASYHLKQFNAYADETHLSLANVKKLSIPSISIATLNAKHQINLPELALEQVNLSDNTKDNIPSLARFKSMNIFDIKLSEDGLSINNIDILGLGLDIKKTKESELAGLIKLNSIDDTNISTADSNEINLPSSGLKSTERNQVKNVPSDNFSIALNKLQLLDSAHINLFDESVQPGIERFFKIQQFDIGPIDNQNPEQLTLLTMDGKSNKYANFKFQAESKPFSTVPYYKLSGLFREVSLPTISTYIKDALNYEFDSGQLDLNIDVTIEDTDINGETKILLRGVELGAANNPNDETLASSSSIPFNYALGMLKDGDGNVELDIPLQGKTTDPDFSIQGFVTLLIKRATMSAAKDYLITTFVPYANIVKVSLIAGDYLLKVRFNDLPFTMGDSDIPVAASPFLDQFSALMKDKEDTELTICAYATPQDIGVKNSTLKLSEAQHKQLKALSLARMNTFKQYMVSEQAIESSRLLLCSPKVDKSENAQARLTFTD